MHHAELSLHILHHPSSPRQRDWLAAWRAWGCTELTPDVEIGIRDDGELIGRFGDSGIVATLIGLPIDAAGEHRHLIEIAAQGRSLVALVADLSPIPCTRDGRCLWFPTPPDPDPQCVLVGVCRLLHSIHLAAATACDDVEALRALCYLSDLGPRIAEIEGRQLAQVACGSGSIRHSARL
jgi:hypothetical protein